MRGKFRFEDVTSFVNCGLLLVDKETRIVYANRDLEQWARFPHQEKIWVGSGHDKGRRFYVKLPGGRGRPG